jgi:hypothetical protein
MMRLKTLLMKLLMLQLEMLLVLPLELLVVERLFVLSDMVSIEFG